MPKVTQEYIDNKKKFMGIEMNCILTACHKSPMGAGCKPKPLFDTLAKSIIYLCGGEE